MERIYVTTRALFSDLGVRVYGIGAAVLGVAMLVWDDFAPFWHPVPLSTPYRGALAYIVASLLIAAGLGIQAPQFLKAGLGVLSTIYLLFALLWLPRVILLPRIYGTWGGFFEQLSPVAAALLACASMHETKSSRGLSRFARILFGICVVSFGLNHFFALPVTARMVPAWIPPGQYFWAVATGIADVLAGIAIVSGVKDVLAARLLTCMIILFGLLIWLPAVYTTPSSRTAWTGNAINLIVASGAWVVGDVLSKSRKEQARVHPAPIEASKA